MIAKSIVAAALSAVAFSKELPKDEILAAELYDNGVRHETIMSLKHATWDAQREAGLMESSQYAAIDEFVPCVDGLVTAVEGDPLQTFKCSNIDLYNFKSHNELGSNNGEGSSVWGWTSDDGREFVAIGQSDGAAFAEISSEGKLIYLGRLPQTTVPAIWREIRSFKNFMVIGSEAVGHNIQIFDMTKLLDVDPAAPVTFTNVVGDENGITGLFTDLPIGRSHNVVTNPDSGFAYAVGAAPRNSSCAAGLIAIDLSDPSNPTSPGCASEDGYVHDAQCLTYKGPDTRYTGQEICYGYNEDTLTIYDYTDKSNPIIVSRTSYEGAAYTHQGWVLDPEWQQYLILDDEYDEFDRVGPAANGKGTTYIWDVSDLTAPKNTGYYQSEITGVDHNQVVSNGLSFQSNYGSGFRVLDVSSIPTDPTGAGVKEVAFFDIYPEDDNEPGAGIVDFVGTWGSYALFESGYQVINSIERGVWVVKMKPEARFARK